MDNSNKDQSQAGEESTHTIVDHSSDIPKPKDERIHRKDKDSGTNLLAKLFSFDFVTTILLFVCAILVAFLLTSFVFQQYEVDGPSMETTLQNQNRLIVIKIARTWADITGHPYVPARGNIIIFNESGLYSSTGVAEKQLVKRVIGLPGERVVVSNGVVTIYNKQHPNGFEPDATLSYGKVITVSSGNIDEVIPKGDVWVMGDNRPDSLDSKYFGPVPVKNIIGRVELRIFPFNEIKAF